MVVKKTWSAPTLKRLQLNDEKLQYLAQKAHLKADVEVERVK